MEVGNEIRSASDDGCSSCPGYGVVERKVAGMRAKSGFAVEHTWQYARICGCR